MPSCIQLLSSAFVATTTFAIAFWFVKTKTEKKSQEKMDKLEIQRKNPDEIIRMPWQKVGVVSKLWIYPVKSCSGVAIDEARAERLGFVVNGMKDRSFLLVSSKSGSLITARKLHPMVKIKAKVHEEILSLEFPGMETLNLDLKNVQDGNNRKETIDLIVTKRRLRSLQSSTHSFSIRIWDNPVNGLDCGDDVATWLSTALQSECRMLYHAALHPQRQTIDKDGRYPLLRTDDTALYADLCGFMLMSASSINDLQQKTTCKISPENFRPNILVEGSIAFDEDKWKYIKIGDTVFRNVKPCDRCTFTTICPTSAIKDPNLEPLKTLRTYRCEEGSTAPLIGINLGVDICGVVRQGDEVYITYE